MKKIFLAASLVVLFSFIPKKFPPDPNRKYKVVLEYTLSQWQAISNSIQGSDQMSARFANEVNQEIFVQISPQIADTLKKSSSTPKPVDSTKRK